MPRFRTNLDQSWEDICTAFLTYEPPGEDEISPKQPFKPLTQSSQQSLAEPNNAHAGVSNNIGQPMLPDKAPEGPSLPEMDSFPSADSSISNQAHSDLPPTGAATSSPVFPPLAPESTQSTLVNLQEVPPPHGSQKVQRFKELQPSDKRVIALVALTIFFVSLTIFLFFWRRSRAQKTEKRHALGVMKNNRSSSASVSSASLGQTIKKCLFKRSSQKRLPILSKRSQKHSVENGVQDADRLPPSPIPQGHSLNLSTQSLAQSSSLGNLPLFPPSAATRPVSWRSSIAKAWEGLGLPNFLLHNQGIQLLPPPTPTFLLQSDQASCDASNIFLGSQSSFSIRENSEFATGDIDKDGELFTISGRTSSCRTSINSLKADIGDQSSTHTKDLEDVLTSPSESFATTSVTGSSSRGKAMKSSIRHFSRSSGEPVG
ncbi:hypothetical protein O181_000075 [Austropuccinia psidii MF-1]|uniref:Uncharacterized protein n=1 Tax=Austropuccinia psidii MF-1 TaxID=1389203 RepID=A0A9Q3GAH6_9BASI|nr:hypothetical protein [Austropuccinia psidii MF-1]